jgi:hypothetical protein
MRIRISVALPPVRNKRRSVSLLSDTGGATLSHYGLIAGLLIFAALLVLGSTGPQLGWLLGALVHGHG